MRDFVSCFSEHAIKVSDYTCSGSSNSTRNSTSDPSVQTAVTTLYRSKLSTNKHLLISVTWHQSSTGLALSIGIDDKPSTSLRYPAPMDFQLIRKKKGSRSYDTGNSIVGLVWDVSLAKYGTGPEPIDNFYIVVFVDAEFALLVGEMSREFVSKFDSSVPVCDFSVVYRTEQVLGRNVFSSKARFHCDRGDHDIAIMIKCKGDVPDADGSELLVFIDKKKVVHAKRLKWNFRGNQTIFVDGVPVDMMWDLRDWFFCIPSGSAVFTFRTRSSLESRLWLEEDLIEREHRTSGFSLLIQAIRSP